jgi:hypothetical protein
MEYLEDTLSGLVALSTVAPTDYEVQNPCETKPVKRMFLYQPFDVINTYSVTFCSIHNWGGVFGGGGD